MCVRVIEKLFELSNLQKWTLVISYASKLKHDFYDQFLTEKRMTKVIKLHLLYLGWDTRTLTREITKGAF